MAGQSQADLQKDMENYQKMQQQIQMVLMQRQQLDMAQAENDRAVEALKKATDGKVYRLAGTVLVPRAKADVEKELAEEAESVKMRKDILVKQEERLKQALTSIISRLEAAQKAARGDGDTGSISG